jgi:hypothetical protein
VVVVPVLPSKPTWAQVQNWFPHEISSAFLLATVSGVFGSVAIGTAIRIASDGIEKGQADLGSSVRFTVSKLLSMWALEIIVGAIVVLGFIALIIPGVILALMFCLVLPVLMIENRGLIECLGRSRKLVGGRWLKTFGFLIVLGIIYGFASLIGAEIGSLFGSGSTLASSLISAVYAPMLPVGLTVYYYSNSARIAPSPPAQAPAFLAGTKSCPICGAQLESTAAFCMKCGAKQP